MEKSILIFIFVATFVSAVSCECKAQYSSKRMICYFANWASGRPDPANMTPEDLDPCLCTHVLYSFVPMANNALNPTGQDLEYFKRMSVWKSKNPNIKVSLSVGGWNEGSNNFNSISSTDANRQQFCQSVIKYCREYNLDGIDIDWEYPQSYQKDSYTAFIKKCNDMFVTESMSSGKSKLLLSAATAPDSGRMAAYDLPKLAEYFDFINPMTYDAHGSWDGNNAHHSPLLGNDGAAAALERYINAGFPPNKLNIGLAAYGRTQSASGQYTREPGILSYYEICKSKTNYVYDNNVKAPSATINGQTCYYEDTVSVSEKVSWALSNEIGGAFIWDASLDDFSGQFCSEGKSPLITAAINKLSAADPIQSTTSTSSTTTTKCKYNPGEFCNGEQGIFEHPTDCSKYVMCGECGETIQTCPPGQLFNAQVFFCDAENSVDCSDKSTITSTEQSSTTSPLIICDGSEKIMAHPNDCAKYIICDGQNEIIESCAENEFFNPDLMFCDAAEFVDCENGTVYQTTTFTTTSDTTTKTTTSSSTTTLAPLEFCKQGSNDILSHPSDCSKYVECKVDSEIVHSCAPGEYFNPDLMFCDAAEFVDCENGTVYQTTTFTTTPDTTTKTTTSSSTTTLAPLEFCKQGSNDILSHPSDCSKYVECKVDSEIVHSCAPGEYFNPDLMFCDAAEFVDCENGTVYQTTASTTTTLAPLEFCKQGSNDILSHPSDCSKYVECKVDSEIVHSCAPGEYFNPDLMFCDAAEFLDCVNGIVQQKTSTKTSYCNSQIGIIPHPTDCSKYIECQADQEIISLCAPGSFYNLEFEECDPDYSCSSSSLPECQAPSFKAHENSCTLFYECQDDEKYHLKECQYGLKFNEPEQACDWPQNVDCSNRK